MKRIEKEVLAEIQAGGVHAASDWAYRALVGDFTNANYMRRIDSVIDLAKQGQIVDHDTSSYHALNVSCLDCESAVE